jgi:hypothetical protein
MLQPAYLYKDILYKYKSKIAFDERYKFYEYDTYVDYDIITDRNSWECIQLVSVDNNDNIIGYFKADINRHVYYVCGLAIINFTPKTNLIFAKDLKQFFLDLFNKYNFNKITFRVVIGNPIEKMYDKLVSNYGGRIVGIYKNNTKLWDGKIYDVKLYEIMKEDFCIFKYKKC